MLINDPVVVDRAIRAKAIARARERGVVLPTFSQLANPARMSAEIVRKLNGVGPDEPSAINLWRVHWFNGEDRQNRVDVPGYVVLPEALTGVKAPIVVLLGRRFPMIAAHKVLPAYAGLVSQMITGQFDPEENKAIWPSTGNYCRGGIAVSRIMGCRGVAVLPAGMSKERFAWLEAQVSHPEDIIRTPGTESNVKEIYDKCAELEKNVKNIILNQFSAFSNYLVHYACTGKAAERAFLSYKGGSSKRLAAFVSATGSAGTIAAGDYLKEQHGTRIAAVEALECPTLLENGFGEHNIQGIGDKHVPLIHNVMNTDFVIAVSDRISDQLNLLFGNPVGRQYLARRRALEQKLIADLAGIGISSFGNITAAIKLAKHMHYGEDDVIVTVATDSDSLYVSEREEYCNKYYPDGFDEIHAGEVFGSCLAGMANDHVVELTEADRRRVFNLGYFTWVEQQGVSVQDFEARRSQAFWKNIVQSIPQWDRLIEEFNAELLP